MRIVFLAPCRGLAGGLRVIAAYGEGLRRRGHDVTIAYPHRPLSLRRCLRHRASRGLARLLGREDGPHFDFFDREFHGRLLALKGDPLSADAHPVLQAADCVVATAWETAEWLAAFRLRTSARYYLIQGYESWNSVPKRLHATYALPFRKIFVSHWLRERVAGAAQDPQILDCPVILNGCDFAAIPESTLTESRPYDIGYVYSGAAHKNPAAALRVLTELRKRRPGLRVAIFGGERPPREALHDGTDFWFRPGGERIRSLYGSASVWLVTSREEGFCLPALEAMRMGSVVAAFDNGGIRDIVSPAVATAMALAPETSGYDRKRHEAVLVRQGAETALTNAVTALLGDPALLASMSRRARERSLRFQWARSIEKFEALMLAKTANAANTKISKVQEPFHERHQHQTR